MADPHAIEEALRRTPLSRGVALMMRKDDIERPLISQLPDGSWYATIYVVRRNGLPLWWPPAANRPRRTRFAATFIAQASELTNMLRAQSVAKRLLELAKVKLARRMRGLKAARAQRAGVGFHRGPGRPPGILRSMEKSGSNRDRKCPECRRRHHMKPCLG